MSASAQNVDFSNVKDGGNFNRKRLPSGDYLATITKIEDAKAKDDTFQYLVSIKINKHTTSVFPYYCKLQENQLWKLRNLLIAGGLTVPKRRFKVDPNKLIGKIIGVTLEDDEYDGKEQSNIAAVFPAAELGDLDAEEPTEDEDSDEDLGDEDLGDLEEPAAEEVAETEVDEETTEDELAGLDRVALKAQLKTFNPAFVAKKSQSDDDLRELLRNAIDDAAKDSGTEDEDEEEEEEAPAPAAKPAARKRAAKPAATVSDDELEELDIDNI